MAQLKLVGSCNRCGLCCTINGMRCSHLRVHHPLGLPGAATCDIYDHRYTGMPIILLTSDGHVGALGACNHNAADEPEIIAQWIGRGCSLKIG